MRCFIKPQYTFPLQVLYPVLTDSNQTILVYKQEGSQEVHLAKSLKGGVVVDAMEELGTRHVAEQPLVLPVAVNQRAEQHQILSKGNHFLHQGERGTDFGTMPVASRH